MMISYKYTYTYTHCSNAICTHYSNTIYTHYSNTSHFGDSTSWQHIIYLQ